VRSKDSRGVWGEAVGKVPFKDNSLAADSTAMLRFLEVGCACGGVLALRVALLARNRVISSGVIRSLENRTEGYVRKSDRGSMNP